LDDLRTHYLELIDDTLIGAPLVHRFAELRNELTSTDPYNEIKVQTIGEAVKSALEHNRRLTHRDDALTAVA
jgi:hypothetical protein